MTDKTQPGQLPGVTLTNFTSQPREKRERYVLDLVRRAHPGSTPLEIVRNFHTPGDAAVVPELCSVVELETDVEIRRLAFYALAHTQDRAATGALIIGLSSNDEASRTHAISALGHLQAREAVLPLINLLQDPASGIKAAKALVNIRDERALEPLRAAARSGRRRYRRELSKLGDELARDVGYH